MSTITLSRQIRPVATEAAAAAVGTAVIRTIKALAALRQAFTTTGSPSRATLERRRDAQRVLAMARRYEDSQPGFAADLRAAASRGMD